MCLIAIGGIGLSSNSLYFIVVFADSLLFLLELKQHLFMSPPEKGNISGFQHLQEVDLVPFVDQLHKTIQLYNEKLETGALSNHSEVAHVLVRMVQLVPS